MLEAFEEPPIEWRTYSTTRRFLKNIITPTTRGSFVEVLSVAKRNLGKRFYDAQFSIESRDENFRWNVCWTESLDGDTRYTMEISDGKPQRRGSMEISDENFR